MTTNGDLGSWTQGEIVRTLERLALTMERVEVKVDALDQKFVPRELHARDLAHVEGRMDEIGLRVTDLEAGMARHVKEQASASSAAWRFWIGLAIAGLALPVAVAIITANIINGA